jgi:hypothetical protein
MAYKSRFTDKPTKRVSAGQLRQKTKDSYSKSFNKQQREVRRDKQQKELDQFKSNLKVAPGTTNLYQEEAPKFNPQTGKYERTTLAQKAIELSNKYGPTPRELLGDIGSGIGSIAGGLMNRVSSGDFGIMGIAKGLYNQVANRASQAKDFLGKQVSKLSNIDLEILKNKEKYNLTSQKPQLQNIYQLEADELSARNTKDILGTRINQMSLGPSVETGTIIRENISPIVPNSLYGMPQQPPGFKVMPEGQQQLLSDIRKADQNMMMAQGGSVDSKLNDIQKKTNNIYGTGILSVR